MNSIRITVECFGASQRWCGAESLQLDLNESADAGQALAALAQRFPDFAARRASVALAMGDAVIPADRRLRDGDRLALIPPVSGG